MEYSSALRRASDIGRRACQYAIPLYSYVDERHAPLGTGFLLRVGEAVFLISADHVMRQASDLSSPVILGTRPRTMALDDEIRISGAEHDYAITRLERTKIECAVPTLGLADLSFEVLPPPAPYVLVGYPGCRRMSRVDHADSRITSNPFHYTTFSVPSGSYGPPQSGSHPLDPLHPEACIALNYTKRRHYKPSTSNQLQLHGFGPDLDGMSGGFAVSLAGRPAIAGVTTNWDRLNRRVIASRMLLLLEAIRQTHSDLAQFIPSRPFLDYAQRRRSPGLLGDLFP